VRSHGCLETWISGTGFRRDHAERTGQTLTGEAIIAAARAGDAEAQASFDRYLDRLGRGLAVIADIVDPDAFVFGGGCRTSTSSTSACPPSSSPRVLRRLARPAGPGPVGRLLGRARRRAPVDAGRLRRLNATSPRLGVT
jgi:fructokinase